jgi:hypothetical protein
MLRTIVHPSDGEQFSATQRRARCASRRGHARGNLLKCILIILEHSSNDDRSDS